jgi:hypothetical protein
MKKKEAIKMWLKKNEFMYIIDMMFLLSVWGQWKNKIFQVESW